MQLADYKLLLYPAFWLVGQHLDAPSIEFLNNVLLATLFRYVINHGFTFCSHVESISQRRKIHDQNPPSEQLRKELDWDNPLIGSVAAALLIVQFTPWVGKMAEFSWTGIALCCLSHYCIVEPAYYAYHRVLHLRNVYKLSHKHHHTSVVTESMSGTSHPFCETVGYLSIFSIPILIPLWLGYLSREILYVYSMFFDTMNCIGHCNFEVMPVWLQWGPLRYFIYSSSYHSLHHTRFLANFCLFCPFWDYLFGTVCPQTYELQNKVWTNTAPKPVSAVFIVHGIEWNSMLYMPMVSPYLATQKCEKSAWMYVFSPMCVAVAILCRFFMKSCFTVQRWAYNDFIGATWSVPRLGYSYLCPREYASINSLLLLAAHQAEAQGATHMGLGALNKAAFLNNGGKDLVPLLREGCSLKVVTGNTLTAAVVHNMVRERAHTGEDIFFTGATSAVGTAVVLRLLQDGYRIRIFTRSKDRFDKLTLLAGDKGDCITRAECYEDGSSSRTWILGSALTQPVQKIVREDATLLQFAVPPSPKDFVSSLSVIPVGNVSFDRRSCDLSVCCNCDEGTLPACLAATIIHSLEGFSDHEVGEIDVSQMDHWFQLASKYGMVRQTCASAEQVLGEVMSEDEGYMIV